MNEWEEKALENADGLAESGVFDKIVKSAYKNRRNKMDKEVRRRVLRNIWHEDMTLNQFWDEIISQEQSMIDEAIKKFANEIIDLHDNEGLNQFIIDLNNLLKQYNIEKI